MRLSFSTVAETMEQFEEDRKDLIGYSHAIYQIMLTLNKMGFNCNVSDGSAPIGISMGFPSDYSFFNHQYKIGYTAWESTELRDGWKDRMLWVDELWATSSWTANVFKETTGREDIHLYPHGIDVSWRPKRRERGDIFRFLHVGEPQVRKNGQLVVDSFIDLFGDDPKYQLVLKCSGINSTRIFFPDGSIAGGPDGKYSNIKIITQPLSHNSMVELFHKTDALIYPTTGEGFGFIPLQALATGMPTATTSPWAEYKKFINVDIPCHSSYSEYQNIHPGNVYEVSQKDVEDSMLDILNNYEKYNKQAYKNSFHVHKEYDWNNVTLPTEKRLRNIFKSRAF